MATKKKVSLAFLARSAESMSAMSERTSKVVEDIREKVNEAESRPGEALMLPLADIVIQEQVRSAISEESVNAIVELLEASGQVHVPISVIPFEGGKWLLIAGERRVRGSLKLGWTTIPANILYGVDEAGARAFQVQENSGREPLSTKDVVYGVIDDYKKGGYARASTVWGHSQSWLAKRIGFDNYKPEIKALLDQEISDDLELLGSLQQMSDIPLPAAERECHQLIEKLMRKEVVRRDDVRLRVKIYRERLEASQQDSTEGAEASAEGVGDKSGKQVDADAQGVGGENSTEVAAASGADQASSVEPTSSVLVAKQTTSETTGGAEKPQVSGLDAARSALYARANALKPSIDKLLLEIKRGDLSVEDEEWVMWCAFIDIAAPAFALLGTTRSIQALRALSTDLKKAKGRSIGDLIAEIHCLENGDVEPSPQRPAAWMVMTDSIGKN